MQGRLHWVLNECMITESLTIAWSVLVGVVKVMSCTVGLVMNLITTLCNHHAGWYSKPSAQFLWSTETSCISLLNAAFWVLPLAFSQWLQQLTLWKKNVYKSYQSFTKCYPRACSSHNSLINGLCLNFFFAIPQNIMIKSTLPCSK